jgi:hypothetical protein
MISEDWQKDYRFCQTSLIIFAKLRFLAKIPPTLMKKYLADPAWALALTWE